MTDSQRISKEASRDKRALAVGHRVPTLEDVSGFGDHSATSWADAKRIRAAALTAGIHLPRLKPSHAK